MFDGLGQKSSTYPPGAGITAAGVHALFIAVALHGSNRTSPHTENPDPGRVYRFDVPEPRATGNASHHGGDESILPGPPAPDFPARISVALPPGLPDFHPGGASLDPGRFSGQSGSSESTLRELPDSGLVYPSDAVDPPEAEVQIVPKYPSALAAMDTGAQLRAQYVVDTMGRVEPGSIVIAATGSRTDSAFESAVRAALLEAKFRPGRRSGRPVRVLVGQSFHFRMGMD
ncbi:MAG: energy transducer TonB [Gemmatimonadota bacterium]